MFCYQCEQTNRGTGCVEMGVCGKDPTIAALQDLLVYVTRGIAAYAVRARALGVTDPDADRFIIEALFTTVTNVNFHPTRLQKTLRQAADVKDRLKTRYEEAALKAGQAPDTLTGASAWTYEDDLDTLVLQGNAVSIPLRMIHQGEERTGLQELMLYGLKGAAAYYHHAFTQGKSDDAVMAAHHELLDLLNQDEAPMEALVAAVLRVGEVNYQVMRLLDEAHTERFGHPEPTSVRVTPVAGKAILVSGHDLPDLAALLEQTAGLGINVYTHGEMLPGHGYPKLKAHPHLAGNYGGAWQNQAEEFDRFPGAILMTTNCIQRPRSAYMDRIFTSGLVAWPGVRHIADQNFALVIEAALAAPGFAESAPEDTILVGFGRAAVLGVADQVIEAVKSGELKRFFLIGGCDGARPGRNYFTEMAQAVPNDCAILTLACGKYRFNKMEFGTVAGLPRLLDMGQCNDAYSAIQVALALAEAFECGVNDLPLSFVLSWYEQKAVAILLTLLHLGVKNIRIGPSLPAFVTPSVLNLLVETFGLTPTGTVEADLQAMLA